MITSKTDRQTEVDKKLWRFLFPVTEREIKFLGGDGVFFSAINYKAIVREDTDKLIAVQKDSYKLVPNAEVIKPIMDQLDLLTTEYYIDESHSFVEDNRMRLQVTFPELTLHDGESDIALSLFIHNSYDSSEGVRMYWGGIRGICSNGCVFGEVLAKYYAKHTSGIVVENLKEQIEDTYEQIPVIQNRIEILQNIESISYYEEKLPELFGKGLTNYVEEQPRADNAWLLYNQLTYYILHYVQQRMRASYQMKVSKLFQL